MYKQLIVNETDHETRVALVEDGTIAELFIKRKNDTDIAGNIYRGRIQRVLPGMQAAFIDIGLEQAAFIYVNDVVDWQAMEIEKEFIEIEEEPLEEIAELVDIDEPLQGTLPTIRLRPIEDVLTEGQEILVHVAKSPIGTKGARVTMNISLPGRFLVLMPTSEHIGVSRRIESEEERRRLKEIVGRCRQNRFGYIIRTAAEGIGEEKLRREMTFLDHLWETVQEKNKNAHAPALLHKELDACLRAVRDLLTEEVESIVIDSKEGYGSILSFLNQHMPGMTSAVKLYIDPEPIFDAYNLEGEILRALKRKIWLKSGGYIVIEETEALVAIDVNTGRYVGKFNLEETIVKTNLEAVKEIAYQIRLRDIGGIIVIDFIDMEKKTNQEKVFAALKDALKRDRSKTHVLPISELGLVQMTRKRIKQSLTSMLREPCIFCEGEGYLISRKTICNTIYRELRREAHDMTGHRLELQVNLEIAEMLLGAENHLIASIERRTGKQVQIYPESEFHLEQFRIFENLKN